ncbi:hypothetical protein OIE71_02035 [Streptomyces sp. NBC_01725]|uniref:hypothetical protein n=1 Tax=Streptomyces sp. NBC_01725 TaxID=2975923 RepID=UPI002E2B2E16|nr:hypothetical protein [Streptomyces sp. NBC_01725]
MPAVGAPALAAQGHTWGSTLSGGRSGSDVTPPQIRVTGHAGGDNALGGPSNSRRLYGDAADPVGSPSLRRPARRARRQGFGGAFGPSGPGHNDHPHLDGRTSRSRSAPSCGVRPANRHAHSGTFPRTRGRSAPPHSLPHSRVGVP